MAGASVETTLELWASSLREVKGRIRRLFSQERVARSAGQFLDGLVGNEPRKTGWMRAEAAGDLGPWRQQAILGRGRWDADALRDIVREYALETLADEDAVLVIDETGFLKQGKASCGVARGRQRGLAGQRLRRAAMAQRQIRGGVSAGLRQRRQYTGSAGKITNCQIGVFASYVSRHGHAFIDRALYLPKEWTDDPTRLKAVHVPDDVGFATKPQIARQMIARALAAKVPFSFVATDTVYGTGDIETMLRKAGKGYVLGVAANHAFNSWGKKQFVRGTAAKIAQSLPKSAWRRLSSGEGTKGPRPPSPCFTGKFIGKKAFPFQIPSFHRTLRASSRLGRKEYRAGSMRSGVALRVRIQDPGNPPYRHQAHPAANPARSHHRVVTVAARPSSRSTRRTS